jgi:hypothetical protein
MIDNMKFIIDGRQLLDLYRGNQSASRLVVARLIREQQLILKTPDSTQDVVKEISRLIQKTTRPIAV